jgi:formate dehydrogenase (NADP+) alpha subunit
MSSNNRLLIHIDDQPVEVEKGLTILQAARQNEIDIPTLCDFPGLPAHGSCRMCIVEIQGRQNTPTACTTLVEEGMVIYTHSSKVQSLRVELIQMLLAEHPSGCLFCPEKDHCDECMVTLRKAGVTTGCGSCPKDNQCELQTLAEKYGIEKPGYPVRYRMLPVEKNDPFFDRDYNLCILCGRCVRVCESLNFANTLTYSSRGTQAQVSTAFYRTHLETNCTFCGSCVEVCPTGALTEKTRKWDGKPEREAATTCPFCSIGCQITLLSKNERVLGSLPNRRAGTNELCVKGRFGVTELVNHPTRLKHPQKRAGMIRQRTDWEDAVGSAVEKLAACSPERFEMQISADCTNEDLFVAYQFARDVMKTSNIRTSAQTRYGSGLENIARLLQDPGSLERLEEAPVILCLGIEDLYAQSVVAVYLNRAKNQGAKIIHLGSRKLGWSSSAEVWLHAEDDQEVGLIQKLVNLTGREESSRQDGGTVTQAESADMARAAHLLQQSGSPVIILGPAILAHTHNQILLKSVEMLKQNLGARVITLSEQSNLSGAMRLGLHSSVPAPEMKELDVLYLIGEAAPALLPGCPFIISHTLVAPAEASPVDLLLPMTAFSEEIGTYIDYTGCVQAVHPAVSPPGETLPSWMILCQIARQMGVAGFDYNCVEDIRQAAQAEFPGFPDTHWPLIAEASQTAAHLIPPSQLDIPNEHSYMGLPLLNLIGGLRNLYPEKTNGSADEPNS